MYHSCLGDLGQAAIIEPPRHAHDLKDTERAPLICTQIMAVHPSIATAKGRGEARGTGASSSSIGGWPVRGGNGARALLPTPKEVSFRAADSRELGTSRKDSTGTVAANMAILSACFKARTRTHFSLVRGISSHVGRLKKIDGGTGESLVQLMVHVSSSIAVFASLVSVDSLACRSAPSFLPTIADQNL